MAAPSPEKPAPMSRKATSCGLASLMKSPGQDVGTNGVHGNRQSGPSPGWDDCRASGELCLVVPGNRVLGQGDQHVAARSAAARVAPDYRNPAGKAQGLGDRLERMVLRAVKAVHRDNERDVVPFEV